MADSIISPASQARRDRRRQGWMQPFQKQTDYGSPGLSGTIDPMESMDMADQAQGWDISDAAPPIRPSAVRLAGYQQPYEDEGEGEGDYEGEEPMDEGDAGPPVRFAQMTGSDPYAVQQSQYQQAYPQMGEQPVCTGPNCPQNNGFSSMGQPQIISERTTHINGVPVGETGGMMSQPMAGATATVSPETMGPQPPTRADDFVAPILTTHDLDDLKVRPQVEALAKVARQHAAEMYSYPVTPENRSNYVPHMAARRAAKEAYDQAFMVINSARAMKASDARSQQVAQNLQIAQERMEAGTYAGSLKDINKALGDTTQPIELRVASITSTLDASFEKQKAAIIAKGGDPSVLKPPGTDVLAVGLRGIAAAHDIGEAYIRHKSLAEGGLTASGIQDLPLALGAFREAFPSPSAMHSYAATERLMVPTISRRIATYNWTVQHGTEIEAGRVPAEPDRATMAGADQEARAIVQRLWNASLPPKQSPQQQPQQQPQQPGASAPSQASGTTPGGGVLLGNPTSTFRLGQ